MKNDQMQNGLTVLTVLQTATTQLKQVHTHTASLDAELLLAYVLKRSREYILAHNEELVEIAQQRKYFSLIRQRAHHVPVAYLVHEAHFYGRPFFVDERVLVPRPETEQIIAECKTQNAKWHSNITIIDIGTGSGCIIVTLAKELAHANVKFVATDISPDALAVAQKNAATHGVAEKISFLQGNVLDPVRDIVEHASGNRIITANLPYVPTAHVAAEPSIAHEPRLALDSGVDGLNHYRELAQQLQTLCHCEKESSTTKQSRPMPNDITLLCEIGEEQGPAMRDIFSFAKSVEIKKDLAGRDRIVIIEL